MNEVAQIVVIPVEEVFERVHISINHLLNNEKFLVRYFLCQNKFKFVLKLQIFNEIESPALLQLLTGFQFFDVCGKLHGTIPNEAKTPLLFLTKGQYVIEGLILFSGNPNFHFVSSAVVPNKIGDSRKLLSGYFFPVLNLCFS